MVFVQASLYRVGRNEAVDLIVLHCTVSPEGSTAAEAVANYFASGSAAGSAHWVHDPDSTVQCVDLGDTAFHAPPVNDRSIGHEMCGQATQSRAQWLDADSLAIIKRTAAAVRADCERFGIPLRRLSNSELAAGLSGIVDHKQVSDVFGVSDHWDPGPGFPWDVFMAELTAEDDMPLNDADKAWIAAQVGNVDAHLSGSLGSHDQQVKDKLNVITVALNGLPDTLLAQPVNASGMNVRGALSRSSADFDVDKGDAATGTSLAAEVAAVKALVAQVLEKLNKP